MTNKLKLYPWTYEHKSELMDHRYKPARPTGIFADVWGGWLWYTPLGTGYRTNGEGEGLWRRASSGADWQQVAGTCQFSLPRGRREAIRSIRAAGYDIAQEGQPEIAGAGGKAWEPTNWELA